MSPVVQGSLVGGAVGLVFALARRPKPGQRDNRAVRVLKSVAEGATAGAGVGFLVGPVRARLAAA